MSTNQPDDLALVHAFLQQNSDIETIEVMVTDMNGVLRGKWLQPAGLEKLLNGGEFKMPLTSVTPDIWGRDVAELCAKTNDGDGLCEPIVGSLHRLPWLKRPTAQLLLQLHDTNNNPWAYDPRVILKNVFAQYQALGLRPVSAPELEFHLFAENLDEKGAPVIPASRSNGHTHTGGQLFAIDAMQEQAPLLYEIRETAKAMQLPLDGIIKELGPSQYEANLMHLDDPVQVADNTQLIKRVIKGVAQKHGYIASFMAKPFTELDGNGLHLHTSILNSDGKNIFDDGTEHGTPELLHAIAGLATSLADSMLVFAPHRNSYRRFIAGGHAPVTPTWGYENRYVAMRIPTGDHKARRIEHRVAGADANPYLLQAVVLAGMLHGINNKLTPGEPTTHTSENVTPTLPRTWQDAVTLFEQSEFIKDYLGEPFRHAFTAIKREEQLEFDRHISAFEYDSYLVMA